MQILVKIDAQAALESLEELGLSKKGPYILRDLLNGLAKRVQANLQQDMADSLKIRRTAFIKNAVKIDRGTFALTNRLSVTIHLDDRADFLSQFESGGEHVPAFGHDHLAFPNRDVFGSKIIRGDNPLRPKNLNLTESKGGYKGNLRTFLIQSSTGTPMILQRTTPHKAKRAKGQMYGLSSKTGTRLLYLLIKASQRPQKIHWYSTVDRTVQGEAQGIWTSVVREALEHLRAKV
jgi:hypothetical protein